MRIGAAMLLVVLLTGSAAASQPRVSATAPDTSTAGTAFAVTLRVAGPAPRAVTVLARRGGNSVSSTARRLGASRYRARLVLRTPGRWALTARIGRRRYPIGSVLVRARERRPVSFLAPGQLLAEPDGALLVAEDGRHRVIRVDPRTGRTAKVAEITEPFGLARSPAGELYVAGGSRVSRLDGGQPMTIATTELEFAALTIAPEGDLFVATVAQVFRIAHGTGSVVPVAGTGERGDGGDGGPATAARLSAPHGLAVAADGDLVLADTRNNRVRRVDGATGTITTVAHIRDAYGIVAAPDGAFFVSEPPTGTVHRLDASGALTTKARGLASPQSLALGPDGTLFVVEGDTGHIRVVSPTGRISTVRRA